VHQQRSVRQEIRAATAYATLPRSLTDCCGPATVLASRFEVEY